jgi:predicted TIM-barrel fold metal-dependent hydrolase
MTSKEFLKIADREISSTPLDRISSSVLQALQNQNFYFDTHIHIFDRQSIPVPYQNSQMFDLHTDANSSHFKQVLQNKINANFAKLVGKIKGILPIESRQETLDFYLRNIALSNKDVIVSTLMMDLEYGWQNKPPKTMSEQINEVKELLKKGYRILPSIAVDPRRVESKSENLFDNFIKAFTGENSFFGVKAYPALGFLPSDKRLFPIYEICQEKNITITTHTGRDSLAYGAPCLDLQGTLVKNSEQIEYKKTLCQNYFFKSKFLNHPKRWESVLEIFPNLRINFAHFGGAIEWQDYGSMKNTRINSILTFMDKYPNVYSDYSFNMHSKKMAIQLQESAKTNPLIQNRTLYGTDYFLTLPEAFFNLKKRQTIFIKNSSEYWNNFSVSNPLKFYKLENYLLNNKVENYEIENFRNKQVI